jgi:hypothetical protein
MSPQGWTSADIDILNLEVIYLWSRQITLCAATFYEQILRLHCSATRNSGDSPHYHNIKRVGWRDGHRNQTISRKGANIISRRPSHGHLARRCCPQAFLRIFSEVTYIRSVGNSSLLKIYTLPNHTITIGVCILETQLLGLFYGCGASFVQKWSMPWISANI